MMEFVHLHLHSEYSLLEGACRIGEIPKAAAAMGQKAVALTDSGVLYGAVAFSEACHAAGVKPIFGCEIFLPGEKDGRGRETDPDSLILLVKDEEGYRNLLVLVSEGFTKGGDPRGPRVSLPTLLSHTGGLIALSGGLSGRAAKKILDGSREGAEEYLKTLAEAFGPGNFYLELQNQGIDGQNMVNGCLAALSEKTGIPLVATNNVHYLKKSDAGIQAVLSCIGSGTLLSQGRKYRFETDEYDMKSGEEMAALFSAYPGAVENTVGIADRCTFDFTFGKTVYPHFPLPPGRSAAEALRSLAEEGLLQKVGEGKIVYEGERTEEVYRRRMEHELSEVTELGYCDYYLIVADYVRYAKGAGIATGPGRGSGVGSLLAYLVGITEVDPVRFGLLFESFLNRERVSMPDFDVDFCYRRRDEVIQYLAKRYGADRVAQIVTFGTMAAKAALRDVGRVTGTPYAEVDRLVRALPEEKGGVTLEEAEKDPAFRELCGASPKYREIVAVAKAIEGMPRNISVHASGVVVTDRPLTEIVPLCMSGDTVVIQYDMGTAEKLGLLKFDVLALKYLTVLSDAEEEIRKREPEFSLADLPLDDRETYAMLSEGRIDGLFQLRAEGMRQLLCAMKPASVADLMTALALWRPGPMESIPKYLANRASPEGIRYKIGGLAEILDETCGCIVYQDQVMQIFRTVAGYSYGKADIVRRAISKKKPEVIAREREGFLAGAAEKGTDPADANALYDEMLGFGGYGLKKSHAAAYAFLSYRGAYLRAHYLPMYYAALITSSTDDVVKMAGYIGECAREGVRTLPPDINESDVSFTVTEEGIRFGLGAVRGVGEAFAEKIVAERRAGGRFLSLHDFAQRLARAQGMSRRLPEMLVKAGAFDSFGLYRSRLLAVCENGLETAFDRTRGGVVGQLSFFDGMQDDYEYPDLPEISLREKLIQEKQSTGLCLSGHLLDGYEKHLAALRPVSLRRLLSSFPREGEAAGEEKTPGKREFHEKQSVTVAGIVTGVTKKATKSGEPMAFATLEDRFGELELIVFPAAYRAVGKKLAPDAALSVSGEISLRDGEVQLLVKSAQELIPDGEFDAREAVRNGTTPPAATQKDTGFAPSAVQKSTSSTPSAAQKDMASAPHAEKRETPASGPISAPGTEQRSPADATPQNSPHAERPAPSAIQKSAGSAHSAAQNNMTSTPPAAPTVKEDAASSTVREGRAELFLRVPDTVGKPYRRCEALASIFSGPVPLIFFDESERVYRKSSLSVGATPFLLGEFVALLGEENVVLRKKG